ncbi:MAG: hypothetical protein K2V38_06580 [Gemmataceae bacterium]|nr:hypothetical protein [Gemmataceae bacterium]
MFRCRDCRKRLFPVLNNRWCRDCLAAREHARAEERYRNALRRRDELNASPLLIRAARGAARGGLLGFWYCAVVLLFVLSIFGDVPAPEARAGHINWKYVRWWFFLSLLGVGVFFLARAFAPVRPRPVAAFAIPLAVAVILGAGFGARRAAAGEWGWWLNLDPPAPPTPSAAH